MKNVTHIFKGILSAATLAAASLAAAEEFTSPALPHAPQGDLELLSAQDLENLAGGTGVEIVVITEGTLDAVNSGNTVTGATIGSGQVEIGQGAFSGYSGLGNFVINTGHNNNLQSSMSVSVTLVPAAPAPSP